MTLLLGEKLRLLRLARGWTHTDLARQLGTVGRSHINNVEANRRPPSLLFILQIAQLFSVTTDYLLRDAIPVDTAVDTRTRTSAQQQQLPTLFGAKLRQLRRQHGMTQHELAEQLGLSANAHISLIERGRHEPSIELVGNIADIFEVSTDYLLWDELPIRP
jgi:transcriptional regulator with XRE-family HTH domain